MSEGEKQLVVDRRVTWSHPDNAVWFWLAFIAGPYLVSYGCGSTVGVLAMVAVWTLGGLEWFRRARLARRTRDAADPLHPYSP